VNGVNPPYHATLFPHRRDGPRMYYKKYFTSARENLTRSEARCGQDSRGPAVPQPGKTDICRALHISKATPYRYVNMGEERSL
jgi:hypothetical protein